MAPTQESPPIDILKTLEIALIWTARYGAALLCLPFEQNWATSVAACFWSGLFAYSIWKKPITAIPILGLVSYVFLESALIASSRGIFIELNPLTSARYFAEDLFFTAIFVGLILSLHGTTTNHATKYRFMVVIPIIYAFYAGALAHSSQAKAFMRHKESNIYFSNIEREYSERAKHPPIKLLHHLLPESVYSFFGQRRSTKGIFEVAYPSYHWTNDIEGEDTYYVFDDEGRLDALTLPDHFSFKDNLHFIGWSFAEVNHRWSLGKSSKLAFSTQPNKSYVGTIRIHGPVYGEQLVESRLNGNLIDIRTITPQEDCCTWELSFAPNHLKEKGLNLLEFSTPNARTPGGGDPRVLSIGLTEIKIN
ncbi:MAG: hypothetical protein MI867_24210 [Pseudomonadales bacterium]|nr:hypothetical protein [Pseudomonadales bacterium]